MDTGRGLTEVELQISLVALHVRPEPVQGPGHQTERGRFSLATI